MPKITASAPILLVRDVVASANYFRDAVGFADDRLWGDLPDFWIAFARAYGAAAVGRRRADNIFRVALVLALLGGAWVITKQLDSR